VGFQAAGDQPVLRFRLAGSALGPAGLAAGASCSTVSASSSPRVRPGVSVSFPLAWDDLDSIKPSDFTIHTALDALGDRDPWAEHMPAPQHLGADLIAEGHEIPVARVQAMHEGKRRARAKRDARPPAEAPED